MEARILDWNWEHYDDRHAVFEPSHISASELRSGADWLIRKFYLPWRIGRRFCRRLAMPGGILRAVYPLALNLAYYGRVWRFHIEGFNPEIRQQSGKEPIESAA